MYVYQSPLLCECRAIHVCANDLHVPFGPPELEVSDWIKNTVALVDVTFGSGNNDNTSTIRVACLEP